MCVFVTMNKEDIFILLCIGKMDHDFMGFDVFHKPLKQDASTYIGYGIGMITIEIYHVSTSKVGQELCTLVGYGERDFIETSLSCPCFLDDV